MAQNCPELSKLQGKFRKALIRNSDAKSFLPNSELKQILEHTEDSVLKQCLTEGDIESVEHKEVLLLIRSGGQRVFTILILMHRHPVKLILNFMRGDQMLLDDLDAKLPLNNNDLEHILKDKSTVLGFDEKQWMVLSPVFTMGRAHRELKHPTILPFIEEKPISNDGGYGIVTKVKIHTAHHHFIENSHTEFQIEMVALKQIRLDGDDGDGKADVFENEKRIMRLLLLNRHENTMQLLSAYSILGGSEGAPSRYFLLMPLADMTLTTLLKTSAMDKLPPTLNEIFGDETNLLREMHGLSSALENLHYYESTDIDLRLKGCHFDLDPRNILIKGRKLMLADFGLSKLKKESSNDCTPFHKGGASHYTAPECISGEYEYHGYRSDIWSFGGIICDILVCMMGGTKLLGQFLDARKHKVNKLTSKRFHIGGEPHPGVDIWMSNHRPKMNFTHQALYTLCQKMLVINPTDRLDSRMVTRHLFTIAAQCQFRSIADGLNHLQDKSQALRLRLEQIKLNIWAQHASISHQALLPMSVDESWILRESSKSHAIKNLLQEASNEIGFLKSEKQLDLPGLLIFETLRDVCERLWALAPSETRRSMAIEAQIGFLALLDMAEDQSSFTSGDIEAPNSNEDRILQLATIKKFTRSIDATDAQNLAGDSFNINIFDETEIHIIKSESESRRKKEKPREWSLVSLNEGTARYLCEWVYYNESLMDIEPQRLHRRVRSIIHQLAIIKSGYQDFRILDCKGYFVKKLDSAFGMIFSLPISGSSQVEPVSLNEILRYTSRPSLTEIFKMVKIMARNIFDFHQIGWVHKNISSHTVIFVDELLWSKMVSIKALKRPSSKSKVENSVEKSKHATSAANSSWWNLKKNIASTNTIPKSNSSRKVPVKNEDNNLRDETAFKLDSLASHYMVGFNHSRADDKNTFTGGGEGLSYEYQHYRYANQAGKPFQPEYDYYSFGLVLLELGLWAPLDKFPFLDQKITEIPLGNLQRTLFEKGVPFLGPVMGEEYQEAVRVCLSDELLDKPKLEVEKIFGKQVLARLERCYV